MATDLARLGLVVDSQGFVRAERDMQRFNRTAKNADKTAAALTRMIKRSAVAFAGFASATLAVRSTIQDFRDFETALVGVAKTTGLAGSDLDRFAERIDQISKEIPVSTNELLGMAQAAGQMGVTGVENLEKFSVTVAKLGRASDLAGDQAATALARILNVTGENISEIDTLASVIVSLGNNVAATESEIANMATRVAQATSAFKVSSADAAALAAAMASVGVQAEAGGTAVGQAFAGINNAVAAGGPALEEFASALGLNGEMLEQLYRGDKMAGFQYFLEQIGELGDGAGLALEAAGLGGIRLSQSLIPLANNTKIFEQTLRLANEEVENATALDREFEATLDTLDSQITLAQNTMSSFGRVIGQSIIPAFSGMLKAFNEFGSEQDNFVRVLSAIRLAAEALALVIGVRLVSSLALSTRGFVAKQAAISASSKATVAAQAAEVSYLRAIQGSLSAQLASNTTEAAKIKIRQQLIVNSTALVAAQNSYTAALARTTVAARATTAALGALRGALALVGGPAGAIVLTVAAIVKMTQASRTYAETTQLVADSVDDMTEAQLRNLAASIRAQKEVVNTNLARLASMKQTSQQVIRETENQMKRFAELEKQLDSVNAEIDALNKTQSTTIDVIEDNITVWNDWSDTVEEAEEQAKDTGDAVDEMAEKVQTLMDRLFPAEAALRDMEASARFLDEALAEGKILLDDYVRATDALVSIAPEAAAELEELGEQAGDTGEEINRAFSNTERFLSSAFMTMFDSADNAFDRIGDAFKDMLARMVADWAASKVMDFFTGGGGGFNLGDIASSVGGFFSQGVSGMWGSITGSVTSGLSNLFSSMAAAWPLAIVAGMAANAKLFDQGVRASQSGIFEQAMDAPGGIANLPIAALSVPSVATGKVLEGLGINDKWAAILSGSSTTQAIADALFGSGFQTTRGGLQLGFDETGANFSAWGRQTNKGGLFGSTKRRFQTSELDSELNQALHQQRFAMIDGIMDLYEAIGIEADRTALEGTRIAMERIGTSGKSEQTEEEIAAAVDAWFSRLQQAMLETAGGLDVETLQAMGGLFQQGLVDPVQMAMDDAAASVMTLQDSYFTISQQTLDLAMAYDGTIQGSQQLTGVLQSQQQAAFALTQQFLQAQGAVESLFGNLSESIRQSLMTEEELYEHQRNQVHQLTDLLATMTDPEAIANTAQRIEQTVSQMWNSLDETQRGVLGEEFLQYLDETEALAQMRLDEGLAALQSGQQELTDIITTGVQQAADAQMNAAQQQLSASQSFSAAVEAFGNYINSGRDREVN